MIKQKRKISIFIATALIICVLCSLLVSCDNSTEETQDKYATFYYQNEAAIEPTAQKIDTSDFRIDATVEDVFKFAEYKYDFGAILKEEENKGLSLSALVNKGINPNKLQEIEIYTDDEESKDKNEDERIDLFGINLYKTSPILSSIKLKAGKNYVFQVKSEYKKPSFEKNFSNESNIYSNVTEPVIDGDFLFVIVDDYLVKLDKDGNEVGNVKLEGNTYFGGMFPPIIIGDNVICGLMGGKVQAINKETLNAVWTYKHSRIISTEQCSYDVASPLTYDKETNSIFVGMYAKDSIENKTIDAEMVAIDASNGQLKSYTSSKEGYYFISPILIQDAFISSKIDKDGTPYIIAYDKTNLAIEFDKIKTKGIVKSSFEYLESENGLFFTSLENGVTYINRIWFDEETNKFGQNRFSEKTASKYSHGQPAIYKNRMYVTSADSSFAPTEGYLQVFDVKSMKEIYRVKTGALNSASFYIKPVTHNKQEEVFVFFTLNKKESGLHYIVDKSNAISGIMYTAHVPEKQNNSMSHIVVDQDGSMYYKNDSNIITKIDKGYFSE